MNEVWAPIPFAPGYAVSNVGDVIGPRGALKTPKTNSGYLTCSIRVNGKKLTTTVQRLVLEAFVGPPPAPDYEANHKNGIKTDNSPENLEWVTRLENMQHAHRTGLIRPKKKKQKKAQSLPELRMRIVVERFDSGEPQRHEFTLMRSRRVDVYRVLVDGQPWATCGLSRVLEGLRKATPRRLSDRAA